MEEILTGLEFRLQKVAQKIRRLEAENELLRQENDTLRTKVSNLETISAPQPEAPEAVGEEAESKEEAFQTALAQAKKTKRDLEIFLREMEKKVSDLRF